MSVKGSGSFYLPAVSGLGWWGGQKVSLVSTHLTTLQKWNEMNGVLGHLCAHKGYPGPRELPEDGEMNEMTLPSRHTILNSSPGGLRASTLSPGHRGSPQYRIFTSERGRNILLLCNLNARGPERSLNPRCPTFQPGSINHCIRPPAWQCYRDINGNYVIYHKLYWNH